jgi:hypothetical protein
MIRVEQRVYKRVLDTPKNGINPRGRCVRWHGGIAESLGRSSAGSESRWVRFPVGEFVNAAVARQRLAPQHEAQAGKDWDGMGDVPDFAEDKRKSFEEGGCRSKVAADQRGHGIGVSLEVYTSFDMEQKKKAVKKLEAAVLRKPQPERRSA